MANRPIYDLMIVNHEAKGKLDTTLLASTLGLPREEIVQKLTAVRDRSINRGYNPYTPQVFLSQLEPEEVGRFEEQLYKFPGFSVRSRTVRQYNYHNAAHLLGYLSEASLTDLERDSTIMRGDFVGRSGVERTYEEVLRGVKGEEIFYRDARGRIQGRLDGGSHDRAPVPGRDLTLSIDAGLQELGERMMRGKRGAIVAIEPETGEILALVTAPNYDPELLAGKNKGTNHRMLEETFGKPLLNRAIQGNYPQLDLQASQGAIFLEEGVLTPSTALACHHVTLRWATDPSATATARPPHSSPPSPLRVMRTSAGVCTLCSTTAAIIPRQPSLVEHWSSV